MLTPRPELSSVGYGFWISPVKFGAVTARAADRQGEISGNKASWIHLIDQKKTVIILSNSDATDINEMRAKFVSASLSAASRITAVSEKAIANSGINPSQIQGTWEIDLRPSPASEPYLKDFVISNLTEKIFAGTFYGSDFTGGQISGNWAGESISRSRRAIKIRVIFIRATSKTAKFPASATARTENSSLRGRAEKKTRAP